MQLPEEFRQTLIQGLKVAKVQLDLDAQGTDSWVLQKQFRMQADEVAHIIRFLEKKEDRHVETTIADELGDIPSYTDPRF